MDNEISVHAGAGLSGTEYSTLLTTDMSTKLDELFGFNYIGKFASSYVPKLQDGSLTIEDIDEPEIFRDIQKIQSVSQSPIRGLTGEIVIPVSREANYNFRSARSFMVAYNESEKVVDYFSGYRRYDSWCSYSELGRVCYRSSSVWCWRIWFI